MSVRVRRTAVLGRGINVPDLKIGYEAFTPHDREFLAWGLENGIDFVAVSFVRVAEEIRKVREFLARRKANVAIIAKIEKREAIANIASIVQGSDAIMVARGDLGVENPIEEIPELQKMIIHTCRIYGVPVITATQMLESMMTNPTPTRAEVTDVANAIFDGTDALMLSEETAVGRYPIECVRYFNRIALRAEESMAAQIIPQERGSVLGDDISDAVSTAAHQISLEIGAKAIVSRLASSKILTKISKLRPSAPIVAMSSQDKALRGFSITWGVYQAKAPEATSLGELIDTSIETLVRERLARNGDRIVVACDELQPSRQRGVTIFVEEITGSARARREGLARAI